MKTKQEAKKLQRMGQGEDTILAHINPGEAAMLKMHGGSGKRNPKTGLLSFGGYEGGGTDMGDPGGNGGGDWSGADVAALSNFMASVGGGNANPNASFFSGASPAINGLQFDPEGTADANRANGTPGIEGQGGFGGPIGDKSMNPFLTTVLNTLLPGLGWGINAFKNYSGSGPLASFGDPSLGGFQGGGGPPNELGAALPGSGGTGATPGTVEPPPPVYPQQPFIRKFGKPRGMLSQFTDPYKIPGLLGGG